MTNADTNHDVSDLFEHLKTIRNPPTEEIFKQVEQHKEAIVPLLMAEIEQIAVNPKAIAIHGDEYIRHVVSMFMLAYFRHQPAYPAIIKLISIPGDSVIKLTGEVFTEALGRILASVYDGNLSPIQKVIENPKLSPWIRSAALDSLMVLWKEGALSRDQLVIYLLELMQGKLESSPSYVWDSIALIAFDIHPKELQEPLRRAIKKKLIAPMVLDEKSLALCLKDDLIEVIKNKGNVVDGYIKFPTIELSWWLYPNDEALFKGMEYASLVVPLVDKKIIPGERAAPMGWRADTLMNGSKKIRRNEPCYCGSGKKYKKCCGANTHLF